jgi:hypothetical protein
LKGMTAEERRASIETDDQVRSDAVNIAKLNQQVSDLEKQRSSLPSSVQIASVAKSAADSATTPQAKEASFGTSATITLADVAKYGKIASQQLAAASQILGDLHVKGPVVDDIAFGAKALSAASALFSISNPFGVLPAIAGVFGIFGHPEPDPLLLKISNQIYQLQQALAKIEDEIRRYHDDEMRELRAVENGLLELYSFLQKEQSAQEAQCLTAYRTVALSNGVANPVRPRFSTLEPENGAEPTLLNAAEFQPAGYEAAAAVWPSIAQHVFNCMAFLEGIFPYERLRQSASIFQISSILQLAANAGVSQEMQDRYNHSMTLYQIFSKLMSIAEHVSIDAKLGSFAPPSNVGDIDWNVKNIDRLKASLRVSTLAGSNGDLKPDLASRAILDPDAVSRTAAELLSVSFWYDFVDTSNKQLLPRSTIVANPPNPFAKGYLATALGIVQISQAQQSVLGGDFLLPLAYERLTGDSSAQGKTLLQAEDQDKCKSQSPGKVKQDCWWDSTALRDLTDIICR